MAIEKSDALILRVIPFRDTSKILTVYTAEQGKVSLLAKGVRGAKPRFGAALEMFAHADLVYYRKASRELQLLAQASLLEAHLGLGGDPDRYAHGCAVAEFLLKALAGQEPPGRLYPLSLRTLEVLETCPHTARRSVFQAFEIKAVSFLGHRPELFRCAGCGGALDRRYGFSAHQGGVLCSDCLAGVDGAFSLDPRCLGYLQVLLRSPLADLTGDPPSPRLLGEADRMLELFLGMHVERFEPLRSLRLARAVAGSGPSERGVRASAVETGFD